MTGSCSLSEFYIFGSLILFLKFFITRQIVRIQVRLIFQRGPPLIRQPLKSGRPAGFGVLKVAAPAPVASSQFLLLYDRGRRRGKGSARVLPRYRELRNLVCEWPF